MNSFGGKIRTLRKQRKLTMDELIVKLNNNYKLNINKGMLSKWENDKVEPRIDVVRCLADFFEISLDELLGLKNFKLDIHEDVSLYEIVNTNFSNVVNIPIVGTVIAGNPILADQNIEGYMPVLSSLINKHKRYFYLKIKGNSMNLEFEEGSYVLVENTNEVENGNIAVILLNGTEATVKKISICGNVITLIPMSNDLQHQPQSFNIENNQIEIRGKVIQAVKVY